MRRLAFVLLPLSTFAATPPLAAQTAPSRGLRAESSTESGSTAPAPTVSLRGLLGTEMALRLLRSADPDERLRGMERLAATHTLDSLALLERTSRPRVPGAADPRPPLDGLARTDPRALLVVVRGLADWGERESARAALSAILEAPSQSFDTRPPASITPDPSAEDAEGAARVLLARQEAAVALAGIGGSSVIEGLVAVARSAGPGQGPALDALALAPPSSPVLAGVALTTPATVGLSTAVGDLRALDAVEGLLAASDPALRASALAALGVAGDTRVAAAARAALADRDPRVRVAAADALARIAAPEAEKALEALISDDVTALDGLRLMDLVQGEGVTKAAAARAAVSANKATRSLAVAALGRQQSASALEALVALARDPATQGDAVGAIARSPCEKATAAIEAMSADASTRRLAARAYLARRWLRSEKSATLDAALSALSASSDARDRAAGLEARVAFGEAPLANALRDPDPRVRRAVALAALARRDAASREAVRAHWPVEHDAVTREILSAAWTEEDAAGLVPTEELARRAGAGRADAPLATFALVRRTIAVDPAGVGPWLASHDAVLRAHAARGLGASGVAAAVGPLVQAYAREGDVEVRRALLEALASLPSGPMREPTLELAARLDPDRIARAAARSALARDASAGCLRGERHDEVAWLRVLAVDSVEPPDGETADLVVPDGLAIPVVFDSDGYAVVPGVPAGDVRLRLAPRTPSYDAQAP